jgi:hypothetical protein
MHLSPSPPPSMQAQRFGMASFVRSWFVTLRPLRGPANTMRAQGPKPCPFHSGVDSSSSSSSSSGHVLPPGSWVRGCRPHSTIPTAPVPIQYTAWEVALCAEGSGFDPCPPHGAFLWGNGIVVVRLAEWPVPCGASVRGRGFGHFASTMCHPV